MFCCHLGMVATCCCGSEQFNLANATKNKERLGLDVGADLNHPAAALISNLNSGWKKSLAEPCVGYLLFRDTATLDLFSSRCTISWFSSCHLSLITLIMEIDCVLVTGNNNLPNLQIMTVYFSALCRPLIDPTFLPKIYTVVALVACCCFFFTIYLKASLDIQWPSNK